MKNIFFYIVLLSSLSISQQLVVKSNGEIKKIPSSSTEIMVTSIDNVLVASESKDEQVRLIIELKAPSRIEQKIRGKVFSKISSQRTQQAVLAAFRDSRIDREFETVINGFTVTTKRGNIQAIASMPDVKSIHLDVAVNAVPASAVPGSVSIPHSTTTVATGKKIRIGIIDTGIDYHHEALGGGFGSGFTVAGGFDFVNNDSDPTDDNGHGTHVAGIISGNSSTITGLAKDALLYSYKALDQNGSGSASTVIAAIERAINDSIQVLNLSLGTSSGSSDDPLSIAVNRAVQSGVVVVVAAGNSGEYTSINSPGIAEYALTVGAADFNTIASFSSKGPETENYRIKPDLVAPGVNILSAKKGGGYIQMSGTSMATPYVTAIAAAMKELHPEWTAIQIKDAVISNSRDIGISLFSQGHGMANENILLCKMFTSPAQISFGFDPPASTTWKQKRSVTIYNTSGIKKNYSLVSTSTNPAIQFHIVPQHIEILSQGSTIIEVELETNNLFLSNNGTFENGYSGNILAIGADDTLTIPFAFMKAPVLTLRFDEIPWMVMIHNKSNFSKTFSPKTNALSIILKEGAYNIVTSFYGSRYVVKEDISVNDKSAVDITSTDAAYPVTFQPINENGEKIDLGSVNGTYSYLEAFVHQATGFAIVVMGGGKTNAYINRGKYFSNVTGNYSYGYSMTLQPTNRSSYTYDVIVDSGISSAKQFVFTAGDMKHVDVKYALDAAVERAFPITWTTFIGKYTTLGVTYYDGTSIPLTFPFSQESFYTQRKNQFPIFHQREAYSF